MAKIKHEQDLDSIAAKNTALYIDVSLAALTVYSLYWLQEWELRRTIEAVAVLNWRLFPDKFAMVGWRQYPDAFRTNRSLLQCQPKYRNWLTGAASKGFSLNARGVQVATELNEKFGPPQTTAGQALGDVTPRVEAAKPATGRARSIEPEREVEKARQGRLFEKWQLGAMSERDLIHVHTLLNIFDHTPVKTRDKRMKDLERSAKDINDTEMIRFLADVRHNFPMVFAGRRTSQ